MLMKNLVFTLSFFFSLHFIQAQGILLDKSFGQNGYRQTTLISPGSRYSPIMDVTPDNNLLLTGGGPSSESGIMFCYYSANGDSIHGFHYPNGYDNFHDVTTIKVLHDGSFLTADYETPIGLKHYYADGTRDTAFGNGGGGLTIPYGHT